MKHLALPVRDQERSRRFYETYFGFNAKPARRYDGDVLMLYNADGFSLALGPTDDPIRLPEFLHFGVHVGPDTRIDNSLSGFSFTGDVASDAYGGAWAVWRSDMDNAALMRRFSQPGTGLTTAPVRVSGAGPGDAGRAPAIASDGHGNLLAAWWGTQGGSPGVFGQRFGGVTASGVSFDTAAGPTSNGNGVLEAGETVDVVTSWRNVHGASLDLAGILSNRLAQFLTATITDGSGDYGTVADGATATCTNCYALRLDPFPFGRPPGHIDVPAMEDLLPQALELRHRWRLHVGDSFTDVPRGSAFYRFVETVQHQGITAGCNSTLFCPAASVTREQIAVFNLRAKEGPAYLPPACTVPRFTDVPASSPFCAWVEELARRGVTGGCDASRYCPGEPVTREQMAVLVLRTLDPALDPPACTTPVFADVPATSPFCRWIEELARRQIAAGCGGGNFCPGAATSREEMAVIVSVAFTLSLGTP